MTYTKIKCFICDKCRTASSFKIQYNMPRLHNINNINMQEPTHAEVLCTNCNITSYQLIVDKQCAKPVLTLLKLGNKTFKAEAGSSNLYNNPTYDKDINPIDKKVKGSINLPIFIINNLIHSFLQFAERKTFEDEYQEFKEVVKIFLDCNFKARFFREDLMLYVEMNSMKEFDDMIAHYEDIEFTFSEQYVEEEKLRLLKDGIEASDINEYFDNLFKTTLIKLNEKLEHLSDKRLKGIENSYKSLIEKYINESGD